MSAKPSFPFKPLSLLVCAALTACSTPPKSGGQLVMGDAIAQTTSATPVPSGLQPTIMPAPRAGMPQPAPSTEAAKRIIPPAPVAEAPKPVASTLPAPVVPNPPPENKIYTGTGAFTKPAAPAVAVQPSAEEVSLNFESADIRSVVQFIMGDVLRETFTIHPSTTGTATIRFSRGVARKDLIPILEMLLRQNNQVMLREEGIYKIMPAVLGTRGSTTPQVGTNSQALPSGFSSQIIQLKYAGVNDMARILEPYATDPQTSIRKDDLRNLLILSGTQRELKHLLEVVDLFDVDYLAGYSVGLFAMSSDVKTLNADLDKIFGAGEKSPLAGIVRIIPIERLNSLLVVTTQPKYLEEAKKWIERLDKGSSASGGIRLNVYPVQHGKADKLAQLLSEIYGNKQGSSSAPTLAPGQRPAQITTPTQAPGQLGQQPQQQAAAASQSLVSFSGGGVGVSKDVRIIADPENNSLLVFAAPADYETIQNALKQLDVPRRQVKVEVLVAEVTLTDDLKYGVEWFIKSRSGVTGAARNVNNTLGRVPGVATGVDIRSVIPAAPGLQLIDVVGGDVRAVLQALGEDKKSQTLSTPNVTVLDNEKATINVGSQISVDTGTTTGAGGVTQTSRQYINTGVILNVTPRINAGGRVTLEINQEISSPDGTGPNPNITTRKAQTVVNVGSGETMVLAGLIQRTRGSGSQGVPLLSKIPILGGLFGSQSFSDNRSELVILITPVVINNAEDSRAVTEELRRKLPSLEGLIPKAKVYDKPKQ
jgi:general secretion pathway protein D